MARKTKVKGRTSCVASSRRGGGAEPGQRSDGGHDQQILAPGDGQAEDA